MLDHLRLEDRERRYAAVRLRSDLPLPERDFVPENGGWPRFDRHESGFPRYGRIARFVRGVVRAGAHPDPLPV
ncbi:MAG: hypothetical protein JO179_07675, partial [Solirubrobacterales bacterium]|nr:hypothetical protein [Solirubrobacterales bacterium]